MDSPEISEELLERLEARVAEVERGTCAELVVVLARRSGEYRDLALFPGAAAAALALLLVMYLPVDVPEPLVLPLVFLAGLVGILAGRRWSRQVGRLATGARRTERARARAKEAFVDEAVSATRDRTGLLLFVSLLEGHVEVIPDHGLDARIPRGEWNRLTADAVARHGVQRWEAVLDELLDGAGSLLAREFPATGDNPDEIPNRPRVL